MLHLAIIIIVSCALSAPSEGIAVIGRKSYESADFCLSDERTPKAREASSIYNVDYEEFSDCVKHKITHRPSFFYNFFINQYRSKNNNYCSIMDSVLKRKKENSGSSEEFAYRKRNLLWTLEGLQSLKTLAPEMPQGATHKPQTKTTTTRRPFLLPCYVLNINEKEKFITLKKPRPPKRKRVRRHTRRRYSVNKPDHFNVKIYPKLPAGELSRVIWKGGFVEKLRHNQASPRFRNSENFIDSERSKNIGVKNALRNGEEEVRFCDDDDDDDPYFRRNSLGYNSNKNTKNVRAGGVKNYVGQSLPKSYFVEMNGRRYPHLNHKFIHRSDGKKRRRCNLNFRKSSSKSFPLVNHYKPHLRQTMYDSQIKENDDLDPENSSNERENIEKPVGFSNSIEQKITHDFSSNLDIPELYPDAKAVKLDKLTWERGFNTKHEIEEYLKERNKIIANDYLGQDNQQLKTGMGSNDFSAPESTLQKPYLSDPKQKKNIPFLNYDFPDYDEIYALSPDFQSRYRGPLKHKHKYKLWRNFSPKIHKGLRRHLNHKIPMDLWKRSPFFKKMDREKKCCCSKSSKCHLSSHKSWKSAPLLCLPYIRKGQDELLKNLISLMQKMVGKADTQKFQLFENTKCKPNTKKVPNEDIMPSAEFDEEDKGGTGSTTEPSGYTLSPCDPCQHLGASQAEHKTETKTTPKPATPYSFSLPNLNQIYTEGTPNCTSEKCYSTLPPFMAPEGSNVTTPVKTTTVCIPTATPKPPSNTKYTSDIPNGESNNATGGTPQKKYPSDTNKTAKERQSNAVSDSYQCQSDQRSNEKFFPEYMDNQENLNILNHSDSSEGSLLPSSSNEPFLLNLPDFDSDEKNSDFSIHNISDGNYRSYEPFSKKDLDNDFDYNSNLNHLKHLTDASRNKGKGSLYHMNLKDRHRKTKHHFHRPMMRLWPPEEDDFYGATSTEMPEDEEEDESQIDRQFHWKRRREESARHHKRRSSKRYKRENDYNSDDFINYDEYLYDSDKNDDDYEKQSPRKLEKNEIDSDVNGLKDDYDWTPLNIEFFTDLATAVKNFQQDSSNTESRDKVLKSVEASISKTGGTASASSTGTSKPLSLLEKINSGEALIASNEPSSAKSSNTTKNENSEKKLALSAQQITVPGTNTSKDTNLNKVLAPPIQPASVPASNSSQNSNLVKPLSPLVVQTVMKPTNSVNTFASGNGDTLMKIPNLVSILASINKTYLTNGTNFYNDLNSMAVIMTSTESASKKASAYTTLSASLKAPPAVKASAASNDKNSVKRIASISEEASGKISDSSKESTSISDSTASIEPISMTTTISSSELKASAVTNAKNFKKVLEDLNEENAPNLSKVSTLTKVTTTSTDSLIKVSAISNDKSSAKALEASNEGNAQNSSKEITSATISMTPTKSTSIKASASSTEQMSVKTSTSAGEQNTTKESGNAHFKEEGTFQSDNTESKPSAKDGIHSITQSSSTEKLERLTNAREENSVDGSSDLDEIEDSQIATTVGTAYIVKGPKKQVIKPSPKMYKKVYPDSLLYDNQKYDTTPITIEIATTASHNGLQKATTGSAAPDVRLQLLAVCEGYLEVVKQMKAQNQSLGEELDSDLSKYCESIISQSFSGKVDSTKLNKMDTISLREGKKDIPNMTKRVGNSLETLKSNNSNSVGSVSTVEKKEKSEAGEGYSSMSVELGENNETKQSQNRRKMNKRKKANNSVKVQEGDDGFMTKGMTQEQLELLRLLKKRKSALLNWMFNSKEGQSQPEYDETEQFDEDAEDKPEALNFELNSGTARPRGAIISRKTTKATLAYTNDSVYPVYAKQYGYDKGGELRRVNVIWRIGNNQSYEKKPLKNQSILAFLLISTASPKAKEKRKFVDINGYSKINKIESQNNNKNFGYTTEVASNVHNSSVAENITKTTKATKAVSNIPNIIIYVNETNSSSVIGTVSNSTNKMIGVTKAPKGIKKTLNKLGKVNTAKEVVEEYTIEFWNYAVYILPIMFSILFLFCCACCAMSILRKRERTRKKKKKKKFTSSEESLSTEDTDSEPKKKRREKSKHLKNVWNALKKKNRDKVDSDIMDESNPPEKKKNFLRFLKSIKSEKAEETSSVPYSALPESDEAETQIEIKKTSHTEVQKKNHEEQKSDQNEAAERRELIILLEELKKIELEQMGEKKEQKSVQVQYMIQDEDESAFRRLGQTNVFGLPKGYSFYSKSLPFHDPEEYGIYKDPGELDKLLPCECDYYGKKHDYFRHCDFPEEGRCDRFFKIFPNAGMCRHKLTKVKKFPDKDRNFADKYGSADTQDGKKSKNEASSREKLRDSTAFNLPRRNPNDWVGDMEYFNRLVTKKKPVRLKDDGVLCRL